ncbi:MAG: TIGR03936 family radical SAM-associated protein [Acidaminococcaceae bacterium]
MKLRIKITKDAGIRFISHLEYVRTIERAIRRAKLAVAYSEGFNPHMKFSLASALGVGVTSEAEFVEIELAEEIDLAATMKKLAVNLPTGIRILAADIADTKTDKLMAQAGGADYRVIVPFEDCDWQAAIANFNEAGSVLFQKPIPKGRGKTKEIEVKNFIEHIEAERSGDDLKLTFSCRITPTGSMKATELLLVLQDSFNLPLVAAKADILRTDLYAVDTEGKKKALLKPEYIA